MHPQAPIEPSEPNGPAESDRPMGQTSQHPHESSSGLASTLEALLFWKGEPMKVSELVKSLDTDGIMKGVREADIIEGLYLLEKNLKAHDRGIALQKKGEGAHMEVTLTTSSKASGIIERLTKEELSKDLGKAALETLSIILFEGPVKRSEIDYIRGVNSTFILRNLLIRGLIEKKPAPNDSRASVYETSFELLSYLGISKIEDLPNYAEIREEIRKFKEGGQTGSTPDQTLDRTEDQAPEETTGNAEMSDDQNADTAQDEEQG